MRIETVAVKHWLAVMCLFLILIFAGLETTHVHPAGDAHDATSCAVCIAVHANAPVLSAHPLPVVFAVETVTLPFRAERKSISAEVALFIRPPPTV